MLGDYSRTTFKREKHYSGVLKQQGRVELDADDNEQLAIQHYRDETEAIDVIGQSGVPKKNDGFRIEIAKVSRSEQDRRFRQMDSRSARRRGLLHR